MRIYLDNCCFNRPFDNQEHMRIRLETEAKLYIQAGIRAKRYSLAWSYILSFENANNPYDEKRESIAPWRQIAEAYCPSSERVLAAGHTIMEQGIKIADALYLACARECGCEYFITTDDRLARKTVPGIRIVNPIDFVRETEIRNENR